MPPSFVFKSVIQYMLKVFLDPYADPNDTQLRYVAAVLITRIVAFMKARRIRRALVRVIQLHALCRDFPVLTQSYPGLAVLLKYSRYFCSSPRKTTVKSLFLVCQTAAPVLKTLIDDAVLSYTPHNDNFVDGILLGDIDDIRAISPSVLGDKLQKKADALRYKEDVDRDNTSIESDDEYILEYLKQHKIRRLSSVQSGIVRACISLIKYDIPEIIRRDAYAEYGIMPLFRSCTVISEALVVGVCRYGIDGNEICDSDIVTQSSMLIAVRNKARLRAGLTELSSVGCSVKTESHVYHLLFDKKYVETVGFSIRAWEFCQKEHHACLLK